MPAITRELLGYLSSTDDPGERLNDLLRRLPVEAPVIRLRKAWVVSSHDLVTTLANNPNLVMPPPTFPEQTRASNPGFVEFFRNSLSVRPPDDHRRLRGVLTREFANRAVERLRGRIDAIVDTLLSRLIEGGGGDFVSAVAAPLPSMVTCAMLGLDEDVWDTVQGWARGMTAHINTSFPGTGEISETPITADEFERMRTFVDGLVRERADGRGDDLISRLNVARAAGTISHDEVVNMILLLFMTGFDTVTVGLANTLLCLHRHPNAWRAVVADPSLRPAAFAEAVRLITPVVVGARTATADIRLGPLDIRSGETVLLMYAAANLDPDRFPEPDEYLLDRERRTPVTFGHGTYFCIGAALAALEVDRVLARLAETAPHFRLATDELPWRRELAFNGPARLPLLLDEVVPA